MNRALSFFVRLMLPPRCLFCRALLGAGAPEVCPRCEAALPYTQGGGLFISEDVVCAAPFFYEGAVRALVHRYKFRGRHALAGSMSDYIARVAGGLGPADFVTWVPVSRRRRRTRGYDQSLLLARGTAARLGLPLAGALRKVRDAPTQNRLPDSAARFQNVAGAFAARPDAVAGRRVLLVDDVFTSGATAAECARALKEAGALSVACAVFAKVRRSSGSGGNAAGKSAAPP